ncbi:N-acetylmannosamine kinase [Yersinia aleksiciae]|nr:N-acetylmannosamine kinase [Yersinia aleksiciae]MDA5499404.1 N-acetylmannosamine kinase [Yersinia aleksiciae]
MGKVLALDIGGTKIAAAVVTESGMLIGRQQVATPRGGAEQLAIALDTLIAPYRHLVDFVAVASTGIISGGRLTALNPANLGGLADFPLQECIQSIADLPCVLLNDGQAAAWAEYQALSDDRNSQISVNNMMFVTVSTGVGGGIILNKKLLVGNHGLAGHIGHTLADPHGLLCGCGRRGCVESVASGTAIGAETLGWKQPAAAAKVFEMAQLGNLQAENIISRSAMAIAQMLADMKMALDLEIVILGGSVGVASHEK